VRYATLCLANLSVGKQSHEFLKEEARIQPSGFFAVLIFFFKHNATILISIFLNKI
jgi:hypothetical protein